MNASIEEFDIIERYFAGKITFSHEHILLGPGDDCGVFTLPTDQAMCISTDTLIAGTHFPDDCAADVVAHRSFAANLSDLAAMGAKPFAYTLALTLDSSSASHDWLESFSRTLERLGMEYQIPLIGGNLAKGRLSLTYTVMGTVGSGCGIQRSGAVIGDDIYVTGHLGDAAGGLRIVQAVGQLSSIATTSAQLVDRYYYPAPRIKLGQALQSVAHSAVDISDGFVSDLSHICSRSGVSALVELDRLPISDALVASVGSDQAELLALSGGDDYELCFSASRKEAEAVNRISLELGVAINRVGSIVERSSDQEWVSLRNAQGKEVDISHVGYRHFE